MARGRRSRPGVTGPVLDAMEQWSLLGLGAARAALELTAEAPHADGPRRPTTADADLARLLPGALLGLSLAAQRRVFDAVAEGEVRLQTVLARLGEHEAVAPAREQLRDFLVAWNSHYEAEQATSAKRAERAASRTAADLADVMMADVDVDALIERIDMEALADRLPIDQVLDRVDLRGLLIEALTDIQVAELLQGGSLLATSTLEALRDQVGVATRLAGRGLRAPVRRTTRTRQVPPDGQGE